MIDVNRMVQSLQSKTMSVDNLFNTLIKKQGSYVTTRPINFRVRNVYNTNVILHQEPDILGCAQDGLAIIDGNLKGEVRLCMTGKMDHSVESDNFLNQFLFIPGIKGHRLCTSSMYDFRFYHIDYHVMITINLNQWIGISNYYGMKLLGFAA